MHGWTHRAKLDFVPQNSAAAARAWHARGGRRPRCQGAGGVVPCRRGPLRGCPKLLPANIRVIGSLHLQRTQLLHNHSSPDHTPQQHDEANGIAPHALRLRPAQLVEQLPRRLAQIPDFLVLRRHVACARVRWRHTRLDRRSRRHHARRAGRAATRRLPVGYFRPGGAEFVPWGQRLCRTSYQESETPKDEFFFDVSSGVHAHEFINANQSKAINKANMPCFTFSYTCNMASKCLSVTATRAQHHVIQT